MRGVRLSARYGSLRRRERSTSEAFLSASFGGLLWCALRTGSQIMDVLSQPGNDRLADFIVEGGPGPAPSFGSAGLPGNGQVWGPGPTGCSINRRGVGPGPQTGPSPGTSAVSEERAAEGGGPYMVYLNYKMRCWTLPSACPGLTFWKKTHIITAVSPP